MYVLAADEISLFAADDSGNLYSYDQRTSKFVLSQTLSFNEAILALAAVSPGAQQLPERMYIEYCVVIMYEKQQIGGEEQCFGCGLVNINKTFVDRLCCVSGIYFVCYFLKGS